MDTVREILEQAVVIRFPREGDARLPWFQRGSPSHRARSVTIGFRSFRHHARGYTERVPDGKANNLAAELDAMAPSRPNSGLRGRIHHDFA